MAKMHTRHKGKSGSKRPVRSNAAKWCGFSTEELTKMVADLARQGRSSSEIGMILRDTYGVADFKLITGKKIYQVMREEGLASRVPEDLYNLIVKALRLNKHLSVNRKDFHNKRQLNLVEAKIRRLVKYYKREGRLPEDWKYSLQAAEMLITR
jgi:small subunit ribosomal protein S15